MFFQSLEVSFSFQLFPICCPFISSFHLSFPFSSLLLPSLSNLSNFYLQTRNLLSCRKINLIAFVTFFLLSFTHPPACPFADCTCLSLHSYTVRSGSTSQERCWGARLQVCLIMPVCLWSLSEPQAETYISRSTVILGCMVHKWIVVDSNLHAEKCWGGG